MLLKPLEDTDMRETERRSACQGYAEFRARLSFLAVRTPGGHQHCDGQTPGEQDSPEVAHGISAALGGDMIGIVSFC